MLFDRNDKAKMAFGSQIDDIIQRIITSEFFSELKYHVCTGIERHSSYMKDQVNSLALLNDTSIEQIKASAKKRGFHIYDDRVSECWFDNDSHTTKWQIWYADMGFASLNETLGVEALTVALGREFTDYQVKEYVTTKASGTREMLKRDGTFQDLKTRCHDDPAHFTMKGSGGFFYFYEHALCQLLPKAEYIDRTVDTLIKERRNRDSAGNLKTPF